MTGPTRENRDRKELIKQIIEQLHKGSSVEEVKAQFREVLSETTPTEIAQIEEELIEEGMAAGEIQRLCDVHLAVFQESLEQAKPDVPAAHPIHILLGEHTLVLQFANELRTVVKKFSKAKDFKAAKAPLKQLDFLVKQFKGSQSHYLREENVLFPYLEKHGITQPPAIMWKEHDKIRELEKDLYTLVEARDQLGFKEFTQKLSPLALALAEMLSSHFQKENSILFPTALKVIKPEEWPVIRGQFDEIGYCPFTPKPPSIEAPAAGVAAPTSGGEGLIPFETGSLSQVELEAVLDSLPVDITFVDKEDTVRYFNQPKDRFFVRTKAVIGRNVQACHPEKSLHAVLKIVDEFKEGKRSSAEFWITIKDRLLFIRYFPVRSKSGEYLGVLEVTQDITDIKGIKGEKRLLD